MNKIADNTVNITVSMNEDITVSITVHKNANKSVNITGGKSALKMPALLPHDAHKH